MDKVEKVMGEYKRGKLKSSSGDKVKSRKQALAIALSEQRRARKGGLMKEARASWKTSKKWPLLKSLKKIWC